MLAQLTATGNTGDDSNTSTGTTTAQEMIDAWNAYVNADSTGNAAAKTAAIKAAAGYTKSGATPATEADGAFDKVQDLVEADATDWTSAPTLTTLAGLKAAKAATPLSADAAAVLDESSSPKASEYAERLTAVQNADYTLYDKAVALVNAYDAWNTANTANQLTESAIKALWDAYVSAYNAISSDDKDGIDALTDHNSAQIGTAGTTTFDAAYAAYADNTYTNGNISSVTLTADAVKAGHTLTDNGDGTYSLVLKYGTQALTDADAVKSLLSVTAVGTVTATGSGTACVLTDAGVTGQSSSTTATEAKVTINVTIADASNEAVVKSVKGQTVTDGKVTVANGVAAAGLAKGDFEADLNGEVKGVSLSSTVADSDSIAANNLIVGANTVYVLITTQAGNSKTVSITVTVQSALA
jgi:hypothetical protein